MPEELLIQFALGELYFTNGQFVEAITRYQSIVESGQRKSLLFPFE